MDVRIDKCEWCGAPLKRASTGRHRRFCGTNCRVAAHRSKEVIDWEPVEEQNLPPLEDVVGAALTGAAASTDDQVNSAILAVSACEITLGRLANECRPEFSWRCAGLSEAIAEARRKFFKGVLP